VIAVALLAGDEAKLDDVLLPALSQGFGGEGVAIAFCKRCIVWFLA